MCWSHVICWANIENFHAFAKYILQDIPIQDGFHINVKHIKDDVQPSFAVDVHMNESLPRYSNSRQPRLLELT